MLILCCYIVCIILPRENLLFRCTSTLWKIALRSDGLAGRIRWSFPFREHRRLLYHQQRTVCRVPSSTRNSWILYRPRRVPHHVGIWILFTSIYSIGGISPLRQCPYWTDPVDTAGRDASLRHVRQCIVLCAIL